MKTNSLFDLKQFFSIAQYKQLKTEIILPTTTAKRSQWILSRALCIYELVDFRNVSKEDHQSAIEFQVNNKSPFKHTGFHAEWRNGLAMVWSWDKVTCTKAIEEQDIEIFEILPESILREQLENDGLVLQSTLDEGCDLQFWANGILLSSCWFAEKPDAESQLNFVKGLFRIPGLPFNTPSPTAIELQPSNLTQQKWSGSSNKSNLFKGFNFEPVLVTLILICSLTYVEWQTIANIKLNSAMSNTEKSIDDAFDKAGPIADARDKSLFYQQQLEQTQSLINFPDQIKLMSTFGQMISKNNDTLKEWRFNLNKLELTIKTNNNNALKYVNDIQALAIVSSVTTEPARKPNHIKIIIELIG